MMAGDAGSSTATGGRTQVMGVLNVTPDSFSDGGRYPDADAAVRHGESLVADGADWVDVGGESTRPGAGRTPQDVELSRIIPVISRLASSGHRVSVDTMRASTAKQAVAAGAALVNDVSGGLADPAMLETAAALGVPIVLMHWRAPSDRMDDCADYWDVTSQVCEELMSRVAAARAAGIEGDRIILDPGLGFAKRPEHNWSLLAGLDRITALGFPVLVGASRKRFLAAVVGGGGLLSGSACAEECADDLLRRPVHERDDATAAISALSASAGAWAVRVHSVRASADAVRVASAMRRHARGQQGPGGAPGEHQRGLLAGLDQICVTGLEVPGRHGVLPVEADQPQPFVIDVIVHADTIGASRADDLARTVDYVTVAAMAERRVSGPRFALIESLAEAIASDVLTLEGAEVVDVRVHKPCAPLPVLVSDVAVAIRRAK